MAAAAALARLEQKQPRARGPTSQDSIRNQGEPRPSHPWGRGTRRLPAAFTPCFLEAVTLCPGPGPDRGPG